MPTGSCAQITVGNDPRITPVGRLLRRTKFDELPQLFNVLVGMMSFVGPRPEVSKYVALYDEEQKKVLSTKPGITDLASIKYLQESEILSRAGTGWEKTYLEQIMPDKLRLNLEYLRKRSLQIDISLIFKTFLRFFTERLVVPKRDDRQRLRRVPKKNVMTLESNPMGEFFSASGTAWSLAKAHGGTRSSRTCFSRSRTIISSSPRRRKSRP